MGLVASPGGKASPTNKAQEAFNRQGGRHVAFVSGFTSNPNLPGGFRFLGPTLKPGGGS